jgi:pyruvate/2-oxoglutarate dehydrogenase complex dihydrolipoamide dehydrogenase (E3) component
MVPGCSPLPLDIDEMLGRVPTVEGVDLLLVGGRTAGKSLATDRAKAGWKVVMVERDKIGGTRPHPDQGSRRLRLHLFTARRAARMGANIDGEPSVSLKRLRQRPIRVDSEGIQVDHEVSTRRSGGHGCAH